MTPIVIGLFGTCGSSKWRDSFMEKYSVLGIEFFNPQVENWHPGCVAEENAHLMNDDIILFPVTEETLGQGSLAEIGFSILAAVRRNPDRYFVIMIDDDCKDPKAHPEAVKDSVRSRKLVKSKVRDFCESNSGVYLVSNLDDMYSLSLRLYNNVRDFRDLKYTYNTYTV